MASGQVGGWLDPLKIRINSASVEVEAELGNSNYESKKYLTVYLLCYDSCRAEVSIKLPRSAVLWTLKFRCHRTAKVQQFYGHF